MAEMILRISTMREHMQTPVIALLSIYIVIPALAGTVGSIRDKLQNSDQKEKITKPPFKLRNYKNIFRVKNLLRLAAIALKYVKNADRLEQTGLSLIAVVAILYIAMGLSTLGLHVSNKIRITLSALAIILPAIFFLQKFKVIPFIRNNYTWIKWCIGFITLAGAYFIGIYADSEIVYLTKSKADNFPNAQKALTFILTVTALWATAVAIGLVAYGLQFLNLMRIFLVETFKLDDLIGRIIYKATPNVELKPYPKEKKKIHMRHEMTLFVGLCLFTVLSIATFDNYVKRGTINFDLKEIIVFTSFHADADACGFPNDNDVSMLILPMGKMIAATHLADGDYVFEPGECKPPLYKPKQKPNLSIFNASL